MFGKNINIIFVSFVILVIIYAVYNMFFNIQEGVNNKAAIKKLMKKGRLSRKQATKIVQYAKRKAAKAGKRLGNLTRVKFKNNKR